MTQSKKIAIIGFGLEGKALYKYFKNQPNTEIHIFDENEIDAPENLTKVHKGLNIPKDFDVAYKTPGIPTSKLQLASKDTKISSLTNLFLEKTKGKVIGITGTKGKGTITTLTDHILSNNGFKSVVVGNIGIPAIEYLKEENEDTFYIYEMSSFQCEHLNKSPHVAVLNNIFPDHLNHHKNLEEYKKAKYKITEFQTSEDYFINASDINIKTKAQQIKLIEARSSKFETKLLGEYNQRNCSVAFEVAKILGIPEEKIREAIKTYEPLPLRLEKIEEVNGITFYDDSLATIPEATLGSIQALENVNTIILGGSDKGSPLEDFAKELTKTSIQNFIIFPTNGKEMVKYVKNDPNSKASKIIGQGRQIFEANSMEEAVKFAYQNTKGICLMSTAAASFGLFKNYKDRSEQYQYWIKKLK
ncbi:UDP-N-acetylmuramoyl-L-alanine--D-glutamate ligase [Patescibacteria group bacterium]|nr:UDP-N-acetylmuramoyl-L-alanine--D-glutamate ligase [Patescibacteria group bacterium]